jgi:hypothetical protein
LKGAYNFLIFEIIFEFLSSSLLSATSSFTGLNTRKIDRHIEELKQHKWFNELFESEKYHRLFFGNVHVRKYLESKLRVHRLIHSPLTQERFKRFLERQSQKTVNV